jgi:hypothetical protein
MTCCRFVIVLSLVVSQSRIWISGFGKNVSFPQPVEAVPFKGGGIAAGHKRWEPRVRIETWGTGPPHLAPRPKRDSAILYSGMKKRVSKAASLPALMASVTLSSWETIAHRTVLMAQNRCSAAEYQKMVVEKAMAANETAMALFFSGGMASIGALLGPWNKRARANATRLRKTRR